MFGSKKKGAAIEETARNFILRAARSADQSFTECCDSILQVLLRNGLLREGVTAMYENKDLKRLYFVSLLTIGIVELGRSHDRQTASAIGEKILWLLRFKSGLGDISARDVVLDCLTEIEANADELRAHDTVALRLMGQLGLPDSEKVRRILRNPLYVTPLTSLLAAAGAGWWTSAEERAELAA